jgi:hypothetical protein
MCIFLTVSYAALQKFAEYRHLIVRRVVAVFEEPNRVQSPVEVSLVLLLSHMEWRDG